MLESRPVEREIEDISVYKSKKETARNGPSQSRERDGKWPLQPRHQFHILVAQRCSSANEFWGYWNRYEGGVGIPIYYYYQHLVCHLWAGGPWDALDSGFVKIMTCVFFPFCSTNKASHKGRGAHSLESSGSFPPLSSPSSESSITPSKADHMWQAIFKCGARYEAAIASASRGVSEQLSKMDF